MSRIMAASAFVVMLVGGAGFGDEEIAVLYTLELQSGSRFGRSLSSLGDLDGDGIGETVVGLKYTYPARVYLFSGLDGSALDTLYSPNPPAGFGWSVDGVDDLNGDGWPDVILGAIEEEPDSCPTTWDSGRAYVFSGGNGEVLHTLESPCEEERGRFGWVVSGVGDVNRDNIEDLAVGTPFEDPGESPEEAGRVHLYDGSTGQLLYTLASPNEEFYGLFGFSICGLPDLDGDGSSEVVVGGPAQDTDTGLLDAGRVYVFSGATGEVLHTLTSPNAEWSGYFGYSVVAVDDVDGDGLRDLLIGAPWEDPGESPGFSGRAYVFSSAGGTVIHELASPNEEWNGHFGSSVAGIGDVDGDEVGDLAVGAPWEDPGGSPMEAGRVYVFSGLSGELLYDLESPNEEEAGHFGAAISGFVTEERGGGPELIVGAPEEWNERGRAYVFGMVTGVDELNAGAPRGLLLSVIGMPVGGNHARLILRLPSDGDVEVSVFDLLGREVKRLHSGWLPAGAHEITWDGLTRNGRDAGSGTYVCRARSEERFAIARLVVVR